MKLRLSIVAIVSLLIFNEGIKAFNNNDFEENKPEKIIASPKINNQALQVYEKIDFNTCKTVLDYTAFETAYWGYMNIKNEFPDKINKDILTICDYSKSANEPRIWTIDLNNYKVIFNDYAAHGQGTGEEYAELFSNKHNSHQTSLGFFLTGETYSGSNGYSLQLHGLDKDFNDNAFDRAIVIHGADYVHESFIKQHKRLGRSWGCPAVPRNIAHSFIDTIKKGTVFYAYYPDKKYLAQSKWLQKEKVYYANNESNLADSSTNTL